MLGAGKNRTCVRGSRTPFYKIPQGDSIDDCRFNASQACVFNGFSVELFLLIKPQQIIFNFSSITGYKNNVEVFFRCSQNLGNLNFDIIYKLQIGKFMYRYKSGLLPESFINMFWVTGQVHSYSTRRSELFYLTLYRTNNQSSLSVSKVLTKFFNSLWNSKCNISIATFCCKLNAFLLS